MAIVQVPRNYKLPSPLICALCGMRLTLEQATAGMWDVENRQLLACASHFSEIEKLVVGWAEVAARERRKYFKRQEQGFRWRGGGNDV